MPETTYVEAIREGIWEEMVRDESVFVMGEDIAEYGGAFKITKGMLEEFGERRVIDTPLSESAIVGAGTGAAIHGLRPVLEMQFSDFMACGFDQITNFAAKCRYRWGQSVPMVIRAPAGGNIHGGPFHSQNVEMPYVHTPGLKVVQPATARDAKGLIKASIRDNDPVIFLEHKYLYRSVKEELPAGDYTVPLGRAEIQREGSDLSILSYGWMVHVALAAAKRLTGEGIDIEVLDLRTLLPLDREAILGTAKKTSKVILLHEDTLTGGLGGELAGIIGEHAFDYLDGPLVRVAAPDTPVPFAETLEQAFLPSEEEVVAKARWLHRF